MSNINIDDCSICWNVLVNDTVKLPCNHVYHITCIESWTKYNNTCPYCRYNFKINNNLNNNRVPLINDYADELIIPDGDIDNLEWSAYKKWNTMFTDLIGKNIQTRHIYLRCTPEIAYERISKRARNEENSIPFEYIKQLHLYHDNWLLNNTRSYIIDVNKDFVYDEKNKNIVYQLMLNTLGSILK